MHLTIEGLTAFITNPLVTSLAAVIAGAIGAWLVGNNAEVRALAVGSADYLEALKEAVKVAELTGAPGARKAAYALSQMDAWLERQGIQGDAKRVTLDRARADLELVRARIFPSAKPPAAIPGSLAPT